MIARIDRYFRTGEWQPLNFNDVKREQTTIAGLEEEIRQLREQVKKAKEDMIYFYPRTKDSDEPAFELPPSIIDKYHNNVLSIRDVMEYWVKHRE